MKNLHHPTSNYKSINYLKGALNPTAIQKSLLEDGYCICRDTNLQNDLFDSRYSSLTITNLRSSVFGENHQNQSMDYAHGTDQRPRYNQILHGVNDKISSTNFIKYHNELCYTSEFPKIVAFVCVLPSQSGGYTPLSNSRQVWNDLPEQMKNKCLEFGIKYIRNVRDSEAENAVENNELDIKAHKCLQELFGTNDRVTMEKLCTEVYGYDFEWVKCGQNGTPMLRIMYNLPAAMILRNDKVDENHKDSTITTFANSMLGMHGTIFDAYDDYYERLPYMERPLHSLWGNGEEFSKEEMDIVSEAFEKNTIRFEWRAGDLIIADNLWWAHGRYPYTGDRKILALMGVPWKRNPKHLFVSSV